MIVEVDSRQHEAALAFLDQAPLRNVYLLGRMLEGGQDMPTEPAYAHYGPTGMDGLFSLGGILLLAARSRAAQEAFARIAHAYDLRGYVIIGEKPDLAGFWEAYHSQGHDARLILSQRFYCLDQTHGSTLEQLATSRLELARPDDLQMVFDAHAAAVLEETGQDVMTIQPEETRQRVATNLQARQIFIIRHQGTLAFKAEFGTMTPRAATLVGVYTSPAQRNLGLATAGTAALCLEGLRRVPNLCLCVNEGNLAAIRVYEKLGFRREAEFLAIFLAE